MALKSTREKIAQDAIKGNVVDFAVQKSVGEAAVKKQDYQQAAASYGSTLDFMEAMLSKSASMPAEQANDLRQKMEAIRAKMGVELADAAKRKEQAHVNGDDP
jgi:ElaB/YqjD/DUF883 family membrane-anchored ribosome-binding protein